MEFSFTTLATLPEYAARTHRHPAALSHKRDGSWHAISGDDFLASVRRLGGDLIARGLRPGDRVGIAADSSPFWVMADLAALGAGAVTVPLFPNASPENLQHQIEDSGMRFLFTGTDAQRELLDPFCRALESVQSLDSLRRAGIFSGGSETDPGLSSPSSPWNSRAAAVRPEDTATLIYTSGSTGVPKAVELTHDNLVSELRAIRRRFPLQPREDSALSFLPLAHVLERLAASYFLASGATVYFAEDPKKAGDNLAEVRPTILTLVPRFLEKVRGRILEKVSASKGISRSIAEAAFRRALEKPPGSKPDVRDRLFDALAYRKVRRNMGGRLRYVICGGAPLDPLLGAFFVNLGLPLYEGYGLTEASPVLTMNFPGHRRWGTVGQALPGVEIRLAGDGEIQARGANVMKGYYRQPEATRATLDPEGWLLTGDLGSLDADGYLTITGRKKELFKSATGRYIAPVPLEQALSLHGLIDGALVVAEGRPFVAALIVPDFDRLRSLKRSLGRAGEDDASFLELGEVRDLFRGAVDEVNERFNPWERVRKFHVVKAPFTVEGGELTPVLKIRRHAVESKFRSEIEAFYGS